MGSDMKVIGVAWTWTNTQLGNSIACKLDRILKNNEWFSSFLELYTITKKLNLSDHVPLVVFLVSLCCNRPKSFKYFNQ